MPADNLNRRETLKRFEQLRNDHLPAWTGALTADDGQTLDQSSNVSSERKKKLIYRTFH